MVYHTRPIVRTSHAMLSQDLSKLSTDGTELYLGFGPPTTASAIPASNTAAILLSGAGGDIVGPSSIYLFLADKLASLEQPVPALSLGYRYPARGRYCVRDVLAAMDELGSGCGMKNCVLVGWSIGGTSVVRIGGSDTRVVGCATIGSQITETVLRLRGCGSWRQGLSCYYMVQATER